MPSTNHICYEERKGKEEGRKGKKREERREKERGEMEEEARTQSKQI